MWCIFILNFYFFLKKNLKKRLKNNKREQLKKPEMTNSVIVVFFSRALAKHLIPIGENQLTNLFYD